MEIKNLLLDTSAARLTASIFGVLGGTGGIRHGIGEIVQGDITPTGLLINSWTAGPLATNMGGEPALTLVPNLLATGLLASSVSFVVIVWSTVFIQRRHGGLILLLLGIGMFLVGGGFGPPMIVILAGLAGIGVGAQFTWWRMHISPGLLHLLAGVWPWIFGFCFINGLLLFIGSLVLVCVFGMNRPDFFLNNFFLTVLSLLLSIISGVAHDIRRAEQ